MTDPIAPAGFEHVFSAEYDWTAAMQKAGRLKLEGEPDIDMNAWDALIQAVGYDPEDLENTITLVDEVEADSNFLKPGDLVVSGGFGADMHFFRRV